MTFNCTTKRPHLQMYYLNSDENTIAPTVWKFIAWVGWQWEKKWCIISENLIQNGIEIRLECNKLWDRSRNFKYALAFAFTLCVLWIAKCIFKISITSIFWHIVLLEGMGIPDFFYISLTVLKHLINFSLLMLSNVACHFSSCY